MNKHVFRKLIAGVVDTHFTIRSFSRDIIGSSAEDTLNINADAAILIDAETGKVLYEKNPDKVLRYC